MLICLRLVRRAVAKSRRLENSARLKRRALGKVGKYVRAKRANIAVRISAPAFIGISVIYFQTSSDLCYLSSNFLRTLLTNFKLPPIFINYLQTSSDPCYLSSNFLRALLTNFKLPRIFINFLQTYSNLY